MSIKKYLDENTFYAANDAQAKSEFLADNRNVGKAFVFNFLGILGMLNGAQNKSLLNTYFRGDLKVRIENITDENKNMSLIIKLMHDQKMFKKDSVVKEITKFLAKLKTGTITQVDDDIVRGWCKQVHQSKLKLGGKPFDFFTKFKKGEWDLIDGTEWIRNVAAKQPDIAGDFHALSLRIGKLTKPTTAVPTQVPVTVGQLLKQAVDKQSDSSVNSDNGKTALDLVKDDSTNVAKVKKQTQDEILKLIFAKYGDTNPNVTLTPEQEKVSDNLDFYHKKSNAFRYEEYEKEYGLTVHKLAEYLINTTSNYRNNNERTHLLDGFVMNNSDLDYMVTPFLKTIFNSNNITLIKECIVRFIGVLSSNNNNTYVLNSIFDAYDNNATFKKAVAEIGFFPIKVSSLYFTSRGYENLTKFLTVSNYNILPVDTSFSTGFLDKTKSDIVSKSRSIDANKIDIVKNHPNNLLKRYYKELLKLSLNDIPKTMAELAQMYDLDVVSFSPLWKATDEQKKVVEENNKHYLSLIISHDWKNENDTNFFDVVDSFGERSGSTRRDFAKFCLDLGKENLDWMLAKIACSSKYLETAPWARSAYSAALTEEHLNKDHNINKFGIIVYGGQKIFSEDFFQSIGQSSEWESYYLVPLFAEAYNNVVDGKVNYIKYANWKFTWYIINHKKQLPKGHLSKLAPYMAKESELLERNVLADATGEELHALYKGDPGSSITLMRALFEGKVKRSSLDKYVHILENDSGSDMYMYTNNTMFKMIKHLNDDMSNLGEAFIAGGCNPSTAHRIGGKKFGGKVLAQVVADKKYFDETYPNGLVSLIDSNGLWDDDVFEAFSNEVSKNFLTVPNYQELLSHSNTKNIRKRDMKNKFKDMVFGMVLDNIETNPDTANKIYNTIDDSFKGQVKNQLLGAGDLVSEIKNSIINPHGKLDKKTLKTLLSFNEINYEEVDNATKIRRPKMKKGEEITAYYKRAGEAMQGYQQNKLGEVKVEEVVVDKEELNRITVDFTRKHHAGNHGAIYPKVIRKFKASIPYDEYEEFFKQQQEAGNLKQIIPAFHGTGGYAANMILRYGFKVLDRTASGVVGRSLGDGIYFSNYIDKSLQYVGNTGYQHGTRGIGTVGYIFKMESILGKNGKDYEEAGTGSSNSRHRFRSPEWVVADARKQLKILEVYEVEVISKMSYLELKGTISESMKIDDFKVENGNVGIFTFWGETIPVGVDEFDIIIVAKPEEANLPEGIEVQEGMNGTEVIFKNVPETFFTDVRYAEGISGDAKEIYFELLKKHSK